MRIFLGSVSTAINKFSQGLSKGLRTQKAYELLILNIICKRNDFSNPEK